MGVSSGYALQGVTATEKLPDNAYTKEILEISYIKSDKSIDKRPIVLYKPANAKGDIPLIFIPHYMADTTTADFVSYIKNGWAVASPHNFQMSYNGVLETDNLVFNNAAFYTLRHLNGIDKQRIAIVGGSAGGYTSLMLNGLQMGAVGAIANSPITNPYFNFKIFFPEADKINQQSSLFDFKMPIQGMVSKYFQPINQIIGDDYAKWEAVSPISLARTMSNPIVINHNTADILVPIDQVTKKYTYAENDGTLPKEFTARLGKNYPNILSSSFEELANPAQISLKKYVFPNNHVTGDMPFSDKLITINIIDDGKISAKGSHNAPYLVGTMNAIPFLQELFKQSLVKTEVLTPEKLLLLINRYQGNSLALPAHQNVDDTIYGSLAIYQKEIIEELKRFAHNRSISELDAVAENTMKMSDAKDDTHETWKQMRQLILN